jgi:hypothetical protein
VALPPRGVLLVRLTYNEAPCILKLHEL